MYVVRGATIISQLDAWGRVYLSMVLFQLFDDFHSSWIMQNFSHGDFNAILDLARSAQRIRISDGDLDTLKMFWDMYHCRIQPLSKEEAIPLLRTFLNIKLPNTNAQWGPPPDRMYLGRIFSQYTDQRYSLGSSSHSTAQLGSSSDSTVQRGIGQIRLGGQPNLGWNSRGWTEVTTGLWRRRLVPSGPWVFPNWLIIFSQRLQHCRWGFEIVCRSCSVHQTDTWLTLYLFLFA